MTYALIALTVVVAVLIVVATLAGLFMLQTFIHELSHVLAAKALGYSVDEFKPWPHRKRGRWYWGRFSLDRPIKHAAIPIAPLFVALAQVVALGGIGFAWWPAWLFAGAAAIDAGNWCVGLFRPQRYWLDAQRWRALR